MRIQDGVTVITGAASGLGLATAQRMVREGGQVVGLDLRWSSEAKENAGSGVTPVEADVRDEDAIRNALQIAGDLGPVRYVVNCAGVGDAERVLTRDGQARSMDLFRKVVDINLIGTFNVIRLAAEEIGRAEMIDGERGVIVNTASVAAVDGQVGQAAYSASKGAVASMSLPLARDLASSAIRVCAIAPGIFDTPLLAQMNEAGQQALRSQIPHPSRFGRPDEYASLVLAIIDNGMLNGELIRLDGGIRLTPR